jgi:hypothetical protein
MKKCEKNEKTVETEAKGLEPAFETERPLGKTLSNREFNYVKARMSGYEGSAALVQAGYAPGSTAIITKLAPFVEELRRKREQVFMEGIVSKEELEAELHRIYLENPDDRVKILAITTLNKMLGYDAPLKSEVNEVQKVFYSFEVLPPPKLPDQNTPTLPENAFPDAGGNI